MDNQTRPLANHQIHPVMKNKTQPINNTPLKLGEAPTYCRRCTNSQGENLIDIYQAANTRLANLNDNLETQKSTLEKHITGIEKSCQSLKDEITVLKIQRKGVEERASKLLAKNLHLKRDNADLSTELLTCKEEKEQRLDVEEENSGLRREVERLREKAGDLQRKFHESEASVEAVGREQYEAGLAAGLGSVIGYE